MKSCLRLLRKLQLHLQINIAISRLNLTTHFIPFQDLHFATQSEEHETRIHSFKLTIYSKLTLNGQQVVFLNDKNIIIWIVTLKGIGLFCLQLINISRIMVQYVLLFKKQCFVAVQLWKDCKLKVETKSRTHCAEMKMIRKEIFFSTMYILPNLWYICSTEVVNMGTKKKRSAVNSQYHRIYLDIKLTIK